MEILNFQAGSLSLQLFFIHTYGFIFLINNFIKDQGFFIFCIIIFQQIKAFNQIKSLFFMNAFEYYFLSEHLQFYLGTHNIEELFEFEQLLVKLNIKLIQFFYITLSFNYFEQLLLIIYKLQFKRIFYHQFTYLNNFLHIFR